MSDYKISLGVQLDTSDLQDQISKAGTNAKPIEIKIDTEVKELTKQINDALKSLSSGTKNALNIDTSALEKSLTGVKEDITEIKNLLSSLGTGSNTKGLVSSINQIGAALDKVSGKFDELQADLSALAKKDFSFNLNFKAGNTNPVKSMTDYGKEARRNAIPALQEQATVLQNLLGGYDKAERALTNYLTKLYKLNGVNVKANLVNDMADTSSISKQMEALEKYIGYLRQIASSKGIDLNGFDAQFSKSANEIVDDTHKIQTGAKQAEEQFAQMGNELRKVFGSGIDAEKLSTQLESIVRSLQEISGTIKNLSSVAGLDGAAQGFNKMSEASENASASASKLKESLDMVTSGGSGASGVAQDIENVGVAADKAENEVDELNGALSGMSVDEAIASVTQKMEALGATVQKTARTMNSDGAYSVKVTGVKELNDGLEQSITLVQRFNKQGIQIDTETFTENIKKADDAFLKLKADADSLSSAASIAKVGEQYNSAERDLRKLSSASDEVKQSFANLTGSYNELVSAQRNYENVMQQSDASKEDQIEAMQRLIAANKKYQNDLATSNSLIKDAAAAQYEFAKAQREADNAEILENKKIGLMSQMNTWLQDNSSATAEWRNRLEELKSTLSGVTDDAGFKKVNSAFSTFKKEAHEAGVEGKTLGETFQQAFSRISMYLSSAALFNYASRALRSMFEQVKAIDTAMTELKKVTDETDASYNKFLTNAASRAKEIGTTIDGLVESTADFARLGYGFEDAQGLAEVANIYTLVGDEIDGVEDATESLISTMAAFKDEMGSLSDSDFALSIVDKFNEVSNNFSISSGGIGEALKRSASSLATANNTLDESIALITAANTVVQDEEKVGNALKTISLRIRGATTELEEAGESTDGMAESTAKLREEILALSGVDIMLDSNTFKSSYQIIDELAEKWQDLTDIQQANSLPEYAEMCA